MHGRARELGAPRRVEVGRSVQTAVEALAVAIRLAKAVYGKVAALGIIGLCGAQAKSAVLTTLGVPYDWPLELTRLLDAIRASR